VHRSVAFIVLGYPRSSETFIAEDIFGLEQRGLDIRIFTLYGQRDQKIQVIHRKIRAPVSMLPERLRDQPTRVLRALIRRITTRSFFETLWIWLTDFAGDPNLDHFRRFGQALVLANELPNEVGHLHAHFLHTPATVTRLAAHLTRLPWSCSAHATDIWTQSSRQISAKLNELEWLVTCTAAGAQHLKEIAADPTKISLAYHGIDLHRFAKPPERQQSRDGRDPQQPVRILSVGRAVEKKGFDVLLTALASLPVDIRWTWTHIGAGKLLPSLRQKANELEINSNVKWLGERNQEEVMAQYRSSDLFVLPCRIARNGDRDGLPNVLLEAQSQCLACLSTTISAIPELIEDGVTGILVAPGNWKDLANAMAGLIRDPALRQRLGEAGRQRVTERFGIQSGLAELAWRFSLPASRKTVIGALEQEV